MSRVEIQDDWCELERPIPERLYFTGLIPEDAAVSVRQRNPDFFNPLTNFRINPLDCLAASASSDARVAHPGNRAAHHNLS